ncbi:MAG TPA: TSUP family transporter [Actinocrinis sp.]|nr:TSUP family transporter [Actinocrinis sp.]
MLITLLAVAGGALAQSVAGFGFALICGPLLLSALGQTDGLRLILTLSSAINLVILLRTFRDCRARDALLLALPGVLLTPLLVAATRHLDKHVLTVTVGVLTLASAAALACGLHLRWLRGPGGAAAAGTTSALMNVLGGLSGPTAALYAVNARWPQESVKPTLQLFGLVLNITALISLGGIAVDWPAGGALLVGWGAGMVVADRLTEGTTRKIVLAVAALGGLFAVGRGLGL